MSIFSILGSWTPRHQSVLSSGAQGTWALCQDHSLVNAAKWSLSRCLGQVHGRFIGCWVTGSLCSLVSQSLSQRGSHRVFLMLLPCSLDRMPVMARCRMPRALRYRSCPLFQRCSPGFIEKLMATGGRDSSQGKIWASRRPLATSSRSKECGSTIYVEGQRGSSLYLATITLSSLKKFLHAFTNILKNYRTFNIGISSERRLHG